MILVHYPRGHIFYFKHDFSIVFISCKYLKFIFILVLEMTFPKGWKADNNKLTDQRSEADCMELWE